MSEPTGTGVPAYVRRPGSGVRPTPRVDVDRPGISTFPAEEQLAATGITWNATLVDWDRIAPSPVERARGRFRAGLPDLIWNTAALEGNAFTLPEVRTLLDGVSVGGKSLEDEAQILALSEAYDRLDRLVGADRFVLDKPVSDELHLLVAAREAIEARHFRGEGQVTGGGDVRLANGGLAPGRDHGRGGILLIGDYRRLIDFLHRVTDSRERSLVYFAAATRAQFYFDGNKRTARLMMTGELMTTGHDAVNIPYARAYEFNQALDELFESNDATALLRFVADCAA